MGIVQSTRHGETIKYTRLHVRTWDDNVSDTDNYSFDLDTSMPLPQKMFMAGLELGEIKGKIELIELYDPVVGIDWDVMTPALACLKEKDLFSKSVSVYYKYEKNKEMVLEAIKIAEKSSGFKFDLVKEYPRERHRFYK